MKTTARWLALVVLLALLPAFSPSIALAQAPCVDIEHHTPSPYLRQALRSGQFTAWKYGSSLILAFRVTACGGKWMFASFRSGTFTTNFMPSRGYQYILEQVRAARATTVGRGMISLALKAIYAGYAMETALFIMVLPTNKELCRQLPQVGAGMGICVVKS